MSIAYPSLPSLALASVPFRSRGLDLSRELVSSRENRVIPFIIAIAIIVLLALAITVVAGAIILCSVHGGVYDTIANIKNGYVSIKCHRL